MAPRTRSSAALLGLVVLASACGGGGGSTTSGGTVAGAVVAGQVGGATVTAYAITGGTMGAQVGSGSTDSAGRFSFSIGDYAGPLMLQASGGTYTDEAMGTTMTMAAGDVMACAIPAVAADAKTTGIQVTPLTSMAHSRAHHMTGGITEANITTANTAVGTYFSVTDILHTVPMNPAIAGAGAGATQDMKNYGMAMAAMSQYAKTIGMPDSSGIVTAMMDDASDGVMDGKMGSSSIPMGGGMMGGTMMASTAGTGGLATAMTAFIGSAMNRSGVTLAAMQDLIDQLGGSSGQLPGAGGGSTAGTMSGTAVKGPVSGGTVAAYAIAGGAMGAQLGSGPTDAAGNFSLSVGSYAGPVMLRMTGGSYADEATGSTMSMMSGDVLEVCVPSMTAGVTMSGLQMTPLTSMASAMARDMSGGMTAANITSANTGMGSYFTVSDIVHTSPMDPTVTGAGAGATQDMKNYGMTLAAMSEYAKTIGMTASSSGVVTVMMEDASDGMMDGKMGSTSISMAGMGGMMGGGMMQSTAGTSGLATAMSTFIGSAMNKSGVGAADMQALMDKLSSSSGAIP